MAPPAAQAARPDLNPSQSLHCYPYPQIKAAALREMVDYLLYLLENLILLCLHDLNIDLATKRRTLKKSFEER